MTCLSKKVLIFTEQNKERDSLGLINAATTIYENIITYALCINWVPNFKAFDFIIQVDNKDLFIQDSRSIASLFFELNEQFNFDCILFPATPIGRNIAPRVAMALDVGLTADVTSIETEGEDVYLIRPAYDGKLMAAIVNIGDNPLMATIRANIFLPTTQVRETQTILFNPKNITKTCMKLISIEKKISTDIRDCKVLVSGGGGTKGYFDKLYPLAEKLDACVSASRSIVDDGIASRTIQVGQSGKIVSPKLYIAIGIYGSLQHIEGLKNVSHIICVNTNKNAPLCSLADIVVEDDGEVFIKKLLKNILFGG